MRTRLLETKKVVKCTISKARFLKRDGNSFFFKTRILLMDKNPREIFEPTPDASEVVNEIKKIVPKEGILRIDLLTDRILRVRYNEGDVIKENNTPMVVGTFKGPTKADLQKIKGNIVISTNEIKLNISTGVFRIEILDLNNNKLCGVGGRERNEANAWDAYNTGICYSKLDKLPIGVECFDLIPHEAIYGFGEKFIRLNKTGQTIDLLMNEATGILSPRSYKNIPFYVSTKGYGVYFNHSCPMTCWVGSMCATNIQVAVEDDFLDYYIIIGNIKDVLSQYTDVTGKGVVPPKWTFGYWQSKISYRAADEVLEIAKRLREAEIPCDVICLDTYWFKQNWYVDLEFDKERFPEPKKFFQDLKQLGFKVSLWQTPYIPEGSQYFEELQAVDGFVKTVNGEIYDTGMCLTPGFKGIAACIDFTNPKAVDVYKKWIGKLLKLGASVIKTDFGENAPLDGVYYNNTPGYQMRNLYPLLYNKAAAEITKEITDGICAWSRSAWAGNQRYPVHWGGDSSVNWENMIPQIEGGLSFGLSGFQFWSQDIGGFFGRPQGNILIRWMQVGLFHSHCRIHGMGKRELYKFKPEVIRICKKYIELRYQLLPYIYGSAFDCVEKSLPMTRALVIKYQNDPNVWNIGNEFMFGDSLLVAPITDETNKRAVYLPVGIWTDWWTGERIEGGKWMNIEVDIETLPLYIREGGIIPMGPIMNYVDEIRTEQINLRISMFERDGKSSFSIPVDNHKIFIEYTSSNGDHQVKISKTEINFIIESFGKENKKLTVIKE